MSLFTDGPVSAIEDLIAQDTQLGNAASVEGIDVTQKLVLAQEELGLELHAMLDASQGAGAPLWLGPQTTLRDVVVTPPLKLWHTFQALTAVYRDAYANQLNDRYAAKRDQFQSQATQAWERLRLQGIGIVRSPVPRAGVPVVAPAAGGLADGAYYVAATWTNGEGAEGAPSLATAISTVASTFLVQPAVPPAGATGWHVYVGTDPVALFRQNASPLAVSQTWTQPDTILTSGVGPGAGQSPEFLMPAPRRILRG